MFFTCRKYLSLICLILAVSASFVYAEDTSSDQAQTESSNWFWNKTVADITFQGLRKVKKSELTGITSGFIGKSLTEQAYSDLVDRLYALDMFDDLTPFAKHDTHDASKVILAFQVKERPVIAVIDFEGNHKIRNNELRDSVSIKVDDIYVDSKVLLDERTLRDLYLKKGYTEAKVSNRTEDTKNGVKIIFTIEEGPATVISQIKFTGNTVVSERTLKSKLTLKESGFLKDGAFQKSSLETDKQKVITYYRDRGYADIRIVDVLQDVQYNEKKERNELTLTFVLQEGVQYTFGGITFRGNQIFTTEKLESFMKLKRGSVFNQTKFQEGLSGVSNLYYENGYMSNQFAPSVNKDPDRKTVTYELSITERSRSHIENIVIKGNTKTKDYVIRREIPIQPGDVFSRDKVMTGMRNLYNLQYFSSIVPEPVSGSEDGLVDLVFTVEEQSTTSVEFGLTFSGVSNPDDIPISLFAKWQNSNLRGEGRSVSADTSISSTEQSIGFSYSQNWVWNLPVAFSESLSFSHSTDSALREEWLPDGTLDESYYYMGFESWNVSLSSSLGRRWTPNFAIISLAGGMTNTLKTHIYDESAYTAYDSSVNQTANRWGLTDSLWTSLSLDDRNINYDPSSGWFMSQRMGWYGLIPQLEHEFYLRSDTKLESYLTLFNIPVAETWSFKAVLAAYTGFTALFPLPDTMLGDSSKPYIDGMFNGRGWTDIYNTARGKAMLSNRVELRVPIAEGMIGLAGFFDAAAVKDEPQQIFNDLSVEDFYFSCGPILRFLVPQFPLHLLFANTFRVEDGNVKWDDTWKFVLSFNIVNK